MHQHLFHTGDPRRNRLLASLPEADWVRFQPLLERVDLPFGDVLCESGTAPTHLFFPTTAIVSLLHATHDGGTTEIAVVGHEGLVGISLFMGGGFMPGDAVVQSAGQGFRLNAQAVAEEAARGGPVLNVLLRYTQTLIENVAQTAVCNRHHSIDQQLCRRLLLGLDRSPTNELRMTQESMAGLLGVRREGITAAAHKLQLAGVIRYRRGHIDVLDREQLEKRACECYAMAGTGSRHRPAATPTADTLATRAPARPAGFGPLVESPTGQRRRTCTSTNMPAKSPANPCHAPLTGDARAA